MNKSKLKSYAPAARREFIQAVTDRANAVGLFSAKNILPLEVKGDVVIIGGKSFPIKVADQRKRLEQRIARDGFEQTMEAVAYTWFNRFVALRYMELHDYLDHGYRVLSNRTGSPIPEILEHATDVNFPGLIQQMAIELKLDGTRDAELYKMLLVAQCNNLHSAMPFLFERIGGETELLLPDNLLHSDSLIRKIVKEIDEEDWQEVEIIGWLYQFYISEKKDQVIGKVVKSEDIPAATQLFTPNWIVKYMVQNTLGRQWLATYPNSPLRGKMEYYIEPAEQTEEIETQLAAITPKELDPETITLLDPAPGSGHILVEAYDLFKEMYLERGYRTRDIPRLVLEKNLYGVEIDDRAAQLAGFAVLMKARAHDRHILDSDNPVQLNILAVQESKEFDIDEIARVLLQERVIKIGTSMPQQQELFQPRATQLPLSGTEKPEVSREQLFSLLDLFKEGKTVGSLLMVPDTLKEALPKFKTLLAKAAQSDAESKVVAAILWPLVKQVELLSRKYNLVVTNPPYMGIRGMNSKLKAFAQHRYSHSKSDLFAMFIERNLHLVANHGYVGMITMQSWMFLSSFENLRNAILNSNSLLAMAHLGSRAFDSIGGEIVSTTAFVLRRDGSPLEKGYFYNLVHGDCEFAKAQSLKGKGDCFCSCSDDFIKLPGAVIAYWITEKIRSLFDNDLLSAKLMSGGRCKTHNDEAYVRYVWEIPKQKVGLKWKHYNKGGQSRKWFGNLMYVFDWSDTAKQYYESHGGLSNSTFWDREGITWSGISGDKTAFRLKIKPSEYASVSPTIIIDDLSTRNQHMAFLNSVIGQELLNIINPTVMVNVGDALKLPDIRNKTTVALVEELIDISQRDWNSFETSFDFRQLPLLSPECFQQSIQETYSQVRRDQHGMVHRMRRLEEDNNSILIGICGLQDELVPEVSLSEITLTCNPYHRYSIDKTEEELEALLLTDTLKELISYAIGCMMGRYSLDQPGLVYAHSGNIDFDLTKYQIFLADEHGIIPIMDMDWFPDDAANRIVEFLRVTWSPEALDENLKFVANSLSPKAGEMPLDTIRRYLSTKFFKDHLHTYKRRPIYWLFSSGKERAFQCLVYLHRYNEGTLSRMRNEYVTPLFGKMNARIDFLTHDIEAASSASLRNKLQKQLDGLKKKLAELAAFDDELRHYADKRIKLDLDDGVKVNYGKFGKLLAEVKAVTGE